MPAPLLAQSFSVRTILIALLSKAANITDDLLQTGDR